MKAANQPQDNYGDEPFIVSNNEETKGDNSPSKVPQNGMQQKGANKNTTQTPGGAAAAGTTEGSQSQKQDQIMGLDSNNN